MKPQEIRKIFDERMGNAEKATVETKKGSLGFKIGWWVGAVLTFFVATGLMWFGTTQFFPVFHIPKLSYLQFLWLWLVLEIFRTRIASKR